MSGRTWAVVWLGALAALGMIWLRRPAPTALEPHPQPVELVAGVAPKPGTPRIVVHVGGPVVAPGLIELDPSARVADAIAEAGGVLPSADLEAVNLAAPLVDGEHVVVPTRGAEIPAQAPVGAADVVVSLNVASVAELETLSGVGPVLAQRIIDFREEHGPFDAVEDLLDVPGIGEGRLAEIRDAVRVP